MKGDSIEGIYDTLKECACISKSAGGIGLSIHNIRAVGSYIRGTNGNSNGIVPMLRVFNDTARYMPMATPIVPGQWHLSWKLKLWSADESYPTFGCAAICKLCNASTSICAAHQTVLACSPAACWAFQRLQVDMGLWSRAGHCG